MAGFTIKQVAEKTGLSVHTLRYYERTGLISSVARAPNGHRRYSEEDVDWIVFLTCLRTTGMSISKMKRYMDLQRQGDTTATERLGLLESYRTAMQKQLQVLSRNLTMIEDKIQRYRAHYKAHL